MSVGDVIAKKLTTSTTGKHRLELSLVVLECQAFVPRESTNDNRPVVPEKDKTEQSFVARIAHTALKPLCAVEHPLTVPRQ